MDRRESIKSLLVGSMAGGMLLNGCSPSDTQTPAAMDAPGYGRTDAEKARDASLLAEQFFTERELTTLAHLCDLILPSNDHFGSASESGVPGFIEFMAKDLPHHQVPIRGGLMWLDHRSNERFSLVFTSCTLAQQKELLDEIAYPDKAAPVVQPGVRFFSLIRNLTLSGYYTSEMGIKDLGYMGNSPNVWDGVPDEILNEHGLQYDAEWLAKCIDQNTRMEVAKWDADGNLI